MIIKKQYNINGEKVYIALTCILLVIISVFKLSYVNREFFVTDYSVYVFLFMPFLLYKALADMKDDMTRMSFNWICVIPMSMYLYRKQFDVLITYSIMGMLSTFLAMNRKQLSISRFLSVSSGFVMLNLVSIYGVGRRLVYNSINEGYIYYCVHNIIKNAKMFGFSEASEGYYNMLEIMPMRVMNRYFIAKNIVQYGIIPVLAIMFTIVAALSAIAYTGYKKGRYFSMMAAVTINIQIICYFLSNIGILENSVYEIIFHGNPTYSVCVLALVCIMFVSKTAPAQKPLRSR